MKDVVVRDTRVRNRVSFAPNPDNPSFGTMPKIVETRRIDDLTKEHLPVGRDGALPTGVEYIFFDQVVELNFAERVDTREQGSCESLTTIGLNRETYHVAWSSDGAQKLRANKWREIPVHPSLVGFMRVFGGSVEVAAQMKRSRGKTVILEGGRHLVSWGRPPSTQEMLTGAGMRRGTDGDTMI